MRRIFLLMNVTLEGYFEGPNDDLSWSKSKFEALSQESDRVVDTFLFGRRTFEMMRSFWPTPAGAQVHAEVARVMNETPKVVVAHAGYEAGWQNVTVISDNVIDQIKQLKAQPGGDIAIFGSNTLCVSLLPHSLIDQIHLMLSPVAIGTGTPLFQGLTQKVDFTLTNSQQFESGVVMLTYAPGG